MAFFERISNGWSLAKASFGVLRMDPELLLFPVISAITCLLVMASFALPVFGMGEDFLAALQDDKTTYEDIVAYVLLFLFYFVNYFVIIFFNSALVACAIIRFKGGNPTLRDGLSASMASIQSIVLWALVAATVGMILRVIESRSENVGRFIAGLMGAAWSVLTYFVVPVLVVENRSPWEAFNRSKNLMIKTWGETFVSNFSLGLINFLIIIVGIVPIVAGGFLISSGAAIIGYVVIALGILFIISGILCTTAAESILLAGLYLYAEEDEVPAAFDAAAFKHAFK